jgi:hypothetical protein
MAGVAGDLVVAQFHCGGTGRIQDAFAHKRVTRMTRWFPPIKANRHPPVSLGGRGREFRLKAEGSEGEGRRD